MARSLLSSSDVTVYLLKGYLFITVTFFIHFDVLTITEMQVTNQC